MRYKILDQHGLNFLTLTVVTGIDLFTRRQCAGCLAASMNCTDSVERPIEKAVGVKISDNMRPNKNFEEVKKNQREIQTNINLRAGTHKVDFIPSGLDNVPANTRPVAVLNSTKKD